MSEQFTIGNYSRRFQLLVVGTLLLSLVLASVAMAALSDVDDTTGLDSPLSDSDNRRASVRRKAQ